MIKKLFNLFGFELIHKEQMKKDRSTLIKLSVAVGKHNGFNEGFIIGAKHAKMQKYSDQLIDHLKKIKQYRAERDLINILTRIGARKKRNWNSVSEIKTK